MRMKGYLSVWIPTYFLECCQEQNHKEYTCNLQYTLGFERYRHSTWCILMSLKNNRVPCVPIQVFFLFKALFVWQVLHNVWIVIHKKTYRY
jgi:hypothetical protein